MTIASGTRLGPYAVDVSMRGSAMKIGTPKLLFHDPLISAGDIRTTESASSSLAAQPLHGRNR